MKHCLHDAPSATYEECFCGKCGKRGSFDKMTSEECTAKRECVCKEVIDDLGKKKLEETS